MEEYMRGKKGLADSSSSDDTEKCLVWCRRIWHPPMLMCNTFTLKRSQKMWNTSTWALHEIKRINPCNMHDEFHEYVEGKKKAYRNHCAGFIRWVYVKLLHISKTWNLNISTETNYTDLQPMSKELQEEKNQSESIIACGHGTTERRPPGLCSDMAEQSGQMPFVCVCVCVPTCVYMSECVWICASLSKSVLLHVTVPVCISRNASPVKARVGSSYGQLASPVVVTAADCHEEGCRKRGKCRRRRRTGR